MASRAVPTKRFIIVGAVLGALASLAVTLLMDILYAEALQGTWRDAIAKDLNRLFHATLTPDSVLVYLAYLVIIVILMAIGAFMGMFFALIVHRFLKLLGAGS